MLDGLTGSWRAALSAAIAIGAGVLFAGPLGGCQYHMIDTPYVSYGDAGRARFAATPAPLRTPEIPVIYVTDRATDSTDEHGPVYGYHRSTGMAYGIAHVSVGEGATWEQLVEDSVRPNRSRTYSPRVARVEELGTFRPLMEWMEARDGRLMPRAETAEGLKAELAAFDEVLARYLDHTERKEVVVFIHGYNNRFDDGVLRLAEAWHFSGRQGVPIVYTWPAGSGGLKGYAYDRESGEFTIAHLKVLLAALARSPRVERVHIVSHSRGTDVAVTALRELNAECRGALRKGLVSGMLGLSDWVPASGTPGGSTRDMLKLRTLVLAAPDLDVEVFVQRFFGENLLEASDRTILYFSKDDDAIGLSDWLFRSRRRVGALRLDDFNPRARSLVAEVEQLQFINCRVTGYTSHSYILQHPAALSDLILVMMDERAPGAEHGRPLTSPWPGMWELDNNYLKPKD